MLRQGWRWLWIWVGVLAAGCGHVWSSDSPRSSTPDSTLPLLGYTLIPPTLTPARWPVYTATPLITADTTGGSVAPIALYLSMSGSACYETPVGSLICMGQVTNGWDKPVEQVTVGVQLLAQDGALLASQEVLVSRWLLPEGASGPYRVLFDRVPEGYAGARAYVTSGQVVPTTNTSHARLTLQPASGTFVRDQYNVTLSIINLNTRPVEQVTITMTLLDNHGLVTGFRRIPIEASRRLDPNEALALTIKVIPQGPNTVAFEAFAEGYYVPE